MMVLLVMFKADGTRRDFPVLKERVVIGRTNNCDLRIPLGSVSRQHCELRLDNGAVTLRDLGSSNGTYVNSSRVQETTLEPGDEIMIGPVVFTLVVDGRPAKIEPVRTLVKKKPANAPTAEDSAGTIAMPTRKDDDLPVMVEAEAHSPTVDLDEAVDDPIAALEAMAESEEEATDLPLLSDAPEADDDLVIEAEVAEEEENELPLLSDEDASEDLPLLSDDEEPPQRK